MKQDERLQMYERLHYTELSRSDSIEADIGTLLTAIAFIGGALAFLGRQLGGSSDAVFNAAYPILIVVGAVTWLACVWFMLRGWWNWEYEDLTLPQDLEEWNSTCLTLGAKALLGYHLLAR